MVHNICGEANKNAGCMIKGECRHKYPKAFAASTSEVGGYPTYRRRSPSQGGDVAVKRITKDKEWIVDNTRIVPYNPGLLLQFDCHINVEVASSVVSVKYLFKYVYKGQDRVMYSIQKETPVGEIDNVPTQPRYVRAS